MKKVTLKHVEIPYQIARKKNKNTYFYFKQDGYIQINLSRYQTEKDAIQFIYENQDNFIKKYERTIQKVERNPNKYYFFGEAFDIKFHRENKMELDTENQALFMPEEVFDHYQDYMKEIERSYMMKYLHELQQNYISNPYVDIKNITLKTRYTTTRHGSCNYRKKTININLNLVRIDKKYTEYVFLHEIAHLNHPNHSQKFYDLLELLCPNYKQIRKELKQIKW